MTTCDGCGAQTGPLMKLSLGKDFFGRAYDRLSPSTDQSPKWYCEPCSMMKNLQRDLRDIRTEFDKLKHGDASALERAEERQRAQLRVREIATIVGAASTPSPLLPLTDVTQLLNDLHAQTTAVS
ncbi:hypothetical protein YTPLAS18_12100 [Nitrospira sp.]|nr:hypothetical protein YTPLAS18_12100 [Nitrospira sp.]